MPVPRVSVRNSVRRPIRPRAGTTTSMRTQPVPWLYGASVRPLRSAKSCVTTPRYSSGTSIDTRSIGSCTLPSTIRVTTWGLPAVSSKPSRRICSSARRAAAPHGPDLPDLGPFCGEDAKRRRYPPVLPKAVRAAARSPCHRPFQPVEPC